MFEYNEQRKQIIWRDLLLCMSTARKTWPETWFRASECIMIESTELRSVEQHFFFFCVYKRHWVFWTSCSSRYDRSSSMSPDAMTFPGINYPISPQIPLSGPLLVFLSGFYHRPRRWSCPWIAKVIRESSLEWYVHKKKKVKLAVFQSGRAEDQSSFSLLRSVEAHLRTRRFRV